MSRTLYISPKNFWIIPSGIRLGNPSETDKFKLKRHHDLVKFALQNASSLLVLSYKTHKRKTSWNGFPTSLWAKFCVQRNRKFLVKVFHRITFIHQRKIEMKRTNERMSTFALLAYIFRYNKDTIRSKWCKVLVHAHAYVCAGCMCVIRWH